MIIKELTKQLFHLIEEKDYDEALKVQDDIVNKSKELKYKLDTYTNFERTYPDIVKTHSAELIDIKANKDGELVCVLKMPKDIFMLVSPYIVDNALETRAAGLPVMMCTFYDDLIEINELHTDRGIKNHVDGLYAFEDKGYGTILLDSMIDYALKNGYKSDCVVKGTLYEGDAATDERKMRRNMFYSKRGFDVKPKIDTENGNIRATIGQLLQNRSNR